MLYGINEHDKEALGPLVEKMTADTAIKQYEHSQELNQAAAAAALYSSSSFIGNVRAASTAASVGE